MNKQSFADLGVSRAVCGALDAQGITEPFAIQSLVVADVLAGRDVLAKSPTGSGKTLAFMVPIIDRIEATDRRPAALILAPTRELATQIVDATYRIAHARALKVKAVYGGVGLEKQAREAAKSHIIVATPGRLEDLLAAARVHARPRQGARARRGRPDARHGLQAARRPDRRAVPARAPDAVLLRDARRRGRPRRRGLHLRPGAPRARAGVERRRRHRAPLPARRARRADPRADPRARGRASSARWSSCAPSAAPTGSSSAWPARARSAVAMHGDKSQRQREKALAELRRRPRRHARRDRRRGARHRRRRHLARHQLRSAGGPRGLRAPHRPHRPRRRHGHRDHVRLERAGRRRLEDRRRARAAPRVRGLGACDLAGSGSRRDRAAACGARTAAAPVARATALAQRRRCTLGGSRSSSGRSAAQRHKRSERAGDTAEPAARAAASPAARVAATRGAELRRSASGRRPRDRGRR